MLSVENENEKFLTDEILSLTLLFLKINTTFEDVVMMPK